MNVVVTGGAGFIGGHLADACMHAGDTVTCFDDLSGGRPENCHGAELVVGDVRDPEALATIFRGAEVVYHLAALGAVPRSVKDPITTDRVNAGGTLAVLVAAREAQVRRVVATSSSSVYGGQGPVPTPEDSPLNPRSPYAVSKVTGEHYCRVFSDLYGLETVVLRPFNVYGPRQRPDSPYAAVIPLFLRAAIEGIRPVIHGDGGQSRDFTYVEDCARLFRLAAAAPSGEVSGRAYNAAGGGEITVADLWKEICALQGRGADPEFVEARAGDVRRSRADLTAAQRDLGYEPQVSLREGLKRTLAWAKTVNS